LTQMSPNNCFVCAAITHTQPAPIPLILLCDQLSKALSSEITKSRHSCDTSTQVKDRAPGSSMDVAQMTCERARPTTRQPQSIHYFHATQKDNRYAMAT
jgi:hypothetical protein